MARDLYEVFRINVQQRLDDLGMRRSDLAEELGVTSSYVSQVLNGHRKPGIDTLAEWAKVLRISAPALITEEIFSRAS